MPPAEDEFWLQQALVEAERGRGGVEPNPMVGAIVVRDGHAVGIGHHERFGGPHAEVLALARAGDAARGATLYVTLEPCCHHGKTPPCTEAVLASGIARVVSAMRDPFPRVNGGGLAQLRQAGLSVQSGIEERASRQLNAPYFKRLATGRPHVIAKWAMTLDGKIATRLGKSHWISGDRSRALVHETRGRMDAIVVGIETALADDPELTARPPGPRRATRVVLDSEARLPLGGKLVRSAREVPMIVGVSTRALADRCHALEALGCEVLRLPGEAGVSVTTLLDELGQRGMSNVLVEGGGRVLGAFFDVGEVDAVDVFLAPIVEGGTHAFTPVRGAGVSQMSEALRLATTEVTLVDRDVRIQGTLHRPWLDVEGMA